MSNKDDNALALKAIEEGIGRDDLRDPSEIIGSGLSIVKEEVGSMAQDAFDSVLLEGRHGAVVLRTHLPMQKPRKIRSSKSSAPKAPVISDSTCWA